MARITSVLLSLALIGGLLFGTMAVAQATGPALPSTNPVNTGMVDLPGASGSPNSVAVRTITQVGNNVWVGGLFSEVDDSNGNMVAPAGDLGVFDATNGLLVPGVHLPIVTSSTSQSTGVPAEVYDSSLGPDGNLYFAGDFDGVDGQVRHGAAAINPTTGALLPFAPNAGVANSILATADAIYVGTTKLLSFQPNSVNTATPGWQSPIASIDASIRGHTTIPAFRDIARLGNKLVAACQCDSITDATGQHFNVKAVVEINAATGAWVNWEPGNLLNPANMKQSAAFGISVIVRNFPGTNTPTIFLAAGGNDFTAAYDFNADVSPNSSNCISPTTPATPCGQQRWLEDTSGSSQAITWYQGFLIVGGHFEWTQKPAPGLQCGDNDNPAKNPDGTFACYYTPKLVAMDPTTGDPIINPSTGKPWNPGICCRYNGVWALLVGSDGSTLHVGGEFTQAGGAWTCTTFQSSCLGTGKVLQQYYARFSGPTALNQTLTVADAGSGSGTVTDNTGAINCGLSCTNDYSTSTNVTLTATPQGSSTFTGWSSADPGVSCPGVGTCTVSMSQTRSVTATFAPISFALTVSKAGTGAGTVTSNPAGVSCGTTCAGPVSPFFVQNTVVNLSETPGPNATFTGWSGDCSGTGACQVTMSQAHSVTATFTSSLQNLSVVRIGPGQGSVMSSPTGINCGATCTKSFSAPSVTLTATPAGGSVFNGWSSNDTGFSCPGVGTCTVTMDMARSVNADFETAKSLSVTITGSGSVTSAPAGINCTSGTCPAAFLLNSTVTLTASPNATSVFTGWSGTDGGTCGTATSCQIVMSKGRAVTATFAAAQTLTVAPAGTGSGTITSTTPSGAITCGLTCQANFLPTQMVTLQATPDANSSSFTGWSGGGCSGAGTCTVTMSASVTITATFAPLPRLLSVAVTGNGVVSSAPIGSGIVCGDGDSPCSASYDHGSNVELDANPDPNWAFTGWGGICSGTDPTCVVTMNGDQSVTATFAHINRTVTVGFSGNGTGSVSDGTGAISCPSSCSASYGQGDTVTLHATPDPNMVFDGWSGDCTNASGDCVLTITGAKNVVADFEPEYTLTVTTSGPGGSVTSDDAGAIDCPGNNCSATYPLGTMVTITPHTNAGYVLDSWGGDCAGVDPTSVCVVAMDSPETVTATFAASQALMVSTTGDGSGSIASDPARINCTNNTGACTANFTQNSTVTLTATPDATSVFTGWTGGGCDGSSAPTCPVSMSSDLSVSANFIATHTLTVQTTGGTAGMVTSDSGGISCPGTCTATYPETATVTLTEASGSNANFTGWTGGGCDGSTASTCQVSMTGDATVTAAFTWITDHVAVTLAGSGTGTVTSDIGGINCPTSCAADINQGSVVNLTATPNTGSTFTGWSGSCLGTTNPCQLTVDAAKNVTATFAPAPRQLTVNVSGTGSVTSDSGGINCPGACGASYPNGTVVTLTESPGSGFSFGGWSGTGVSCPGTPTTCAVTMNADTTVTATFTQNPSLNLTFAGSGGGGVVSSPSGINCSANCSASFTPNTLVTLTETPAAGSTFVGWSGDCSGTGMCQVTMSVARNVTATFNGPTPMKIDDTDPAVAYNGWVGVADAAANGGFYRMSNVKNDKATWKSPSTTSITFVTRKGPDQGKASVTIDGTNKGTLDLYAATASSFSQVYSGLGSGVHTVVIKVLHTQNIASSGFNVRLDAFIVGSTTTQESDPSIQYDTWKDTAKNLAQGGSYRSTSTNTATATVTFSGTGIDWISGTGSSYGKASVTIDGVSKGTVDLYSPATHWTTTAGSYLGLSAGPHTMVIQVLGQKNASSSGTKVLIDGFTIHA